MGTIWKRKLEPSELRAKWLPMSSHQRWLVSSPTAKNGDSEVYKLTRSDLLIFQSFSNLTENARKCFELVVLMP